MPRTGRLVLAAAVSAMVAAVAVAEDKSATEEPSAETLEMIAQGKQVAYDRKKGNCLACHAMDDGTLPGTIGPPLLAMKIRFPNKDDLRAQIWDATVRNPHTMMPPFGRHKILTDEEINLITEYVYTL